MIPESEPHIRANELFEKAEVMLAKGDFFEAIPLLKKALELNPHFLFVYFRLAQALFNLERKDESLKAIDKCLSLDPAFDRAVLFKAKCLNALGKNTETINYLSANRKRPLAARAFRLFKKNAGEQK